MLLLNVDFDETGQTDTGPGSGGQSPLWLPSHLIIDTFKIPLDNWYFQDWHCQGWQVLVSIMWGLNAVCVFKERGTPSPRSKHLWVREASRGRGEADTLFAICNHLLSFSVWTFCTFSLGPLLLWLSKRKGGGRLVTCKPYHPTITHLPISLLQKLPYHQIDLKSPPRWRGQRWECQQSSSSQGHPSDQVVAVPPGLTGDADDRGRVILNPILSGRLSFPPADMGGPYKWVYKVAEWVKVKYDSCLRTSTESRRVTIFIG